MVQEQDNDGDTVLELDHPDSPLCITPDAKEYAYYVFDDLKHERNRSSEDVVRRECAWWQEAALVDSYPSLKTKTTMLVSMDKLRSATKYFERQFSLCAPIRDVSIEWESGLGGTRRMLNVVSACGWDERAMTILMTAINSEDGIDFKDLSRLPPSPNELHTDFELALMLEYYGCHENLRRMIRPLTLALGKKRPSNVEMSHSLRKYATIACVFKDVDLIQKVFSTLVHDSICPFDPYNLPISTNLLDLRKLQHQARSDRPAHFCNKKCVDSFLSALRAYENEYPTMSIEPSTSESLTGKDISLFRSYRSMRHLIDAQARCEGRGRSCRLYRHLRSVRGKCKELISTSSKRAVAKVSEEPRSWDDPFEG
ncbi:unnamed protein product [Clonostachys chloroleuca]|uniref:Uncharacterized protein n=1 Tax=Clonostachys chloroleuca TaxID=1926264 RepID=A0AA35PZV9_9HYPO|nr:unnamed protein product [Clonostachys chloroleuca]